MKKIIFVLVLIIVVLFAVYFVIRKNPQPEIFISNVSSTTATTISTSSDGSMDSIPEKPTAQAAIKKVIIKNFSFDSAQIDIKVGDKVIWTNQDVAPHSIVINGAGQSAGLSQGDNFEQVFSRPGVYSYICGIHPSMKGEIVVRE